MFRLFKNWAGVWRRIWRGACLSFELFLDEKVPDFDPSVRLIISDGNVRVGSGVTFQEF